MDIASEKNGTRTDVQPALTEDDRWYQDYLRWRRARLRLVQASARVWLSVLTTLLGLLGSVVLFKGGALVTGVTSSGWWQAVLIVLVGSVFAAAVLAVVVGGVATWGGLEDIPPDGLGSPPQVLPAYKTRRWGKILFRVVLKLAMIPPDDRKKALEVFEGKDVRQNQDPEFAWQRYRADIVDNADRNRVYLHASRVLGVFAAVFIAALAIAAVFAGTIAPAPADVIVVHNGRLACGPFSASAKDTEVTQVVPVTSC